jgi:hypothetical protein
MTLERLQQHFAARVLRYSSGLNGCLVVAQLPRNPVGKVGARRVVAAATEAQ